MTRDEELYRIATKRPRWWLSIWHWGDLLRDCLSQLKRTSEETENHLACFRREQDRAENLETLAHGARESLKSARADLIAEKTLCADYAVQLGKLKVDFEKSLSGMRELEIRLAAENLCTERLKAELAQAKAEIAKYEADGAKRATSDAERRMVMVALLEWVHANQRLAAPMEGIRKLLLTGKKLGAVLFLLLPVCLLGQLPPLQRGPFTTNLPAWANTNVMSLSTSNATSKPLTNHYQDGVLTLFGLQAGAGATLTMTPSNIVISAPGAGGGLTTNEFQFLGVPLTIISGVRLTNAALFGITTGAVVEPFADISGSIGSVTRNYQSVWALSWNIRDGNGDAEWINIQAPDLTGGGYSLLLPTDQGGNGQVITNDGLGNLGWWTPISSSGLTTNANQFLGVPLAIRAGALLTNVVVQQSNNTSVSLIVSNNPGSTRNLIEAYNTNRNGFKVTSNGVFEVRGGSLGDNPVVFIENTTANQTYTIWTNGVGGNGSFIMRTDNAGNAVFSPGQTAGETYFGGPDSGSGIVNFNLVTVGAVWRMVPSSAVAAWHGSTLRRGQITNVWDIFCRSNMTWIEVGGSDVVSLQSTSSMSSYTMFLPITNGLAGQVLYNVGGGALSWKDDATGAGGLTTNSSQFGASVELTIKKGAFLTNMNYWSTGTNHGVLYQDQDVLALNTKTWNIGSADNAFSDMFSTAHSFVETGAGTDLIRLQAPAAIAASYTMLLPDAQGADGQTITNNGAGTLGWWTPGGPLGFNQNQFASNGVVVSIVSGVVLTNATLHGTTTVIGPQTNASSLNVADGHTNWIGAETKGTLLASSNLLVKAGQSPSNAWVGGTYWWNTDRWTNHTATANLTNLATNIVAAHVLTNNGDTVHITWRIKLANLLANTNQFQIIYGSQTVLDTGLLPSSNSVCTADLWITRTGDTSQHAEGRFEWGPGSGAPFAFTNTNVELVQTNGIATIFQLRHAARRVGAATNNWTRGWFDPAVR